MHSFNKQMLTPLLCHLGPEMQGRPTQGLWGKVSTLDSASKQGLDGWVGLCQVRKGVRGIPNRGSGSAKPRPLSLRKMAPQRECGDRAERPGGCSPASLHASSLHFFSFLFFCCLFRGAHAADGGSQAGGPIGSTAASLRHSHSDAGTKPHL